MGIISILKGRLVGCWLPRNTDPLWPLFKTCLKPHILCSKHPGFIAAGLLGKQRQKQNQTLKSTSHVLMNNEYLGTEMLEFSQTGGQTYVFEIACSTSPLKKHLGSPLY